MMSSPVRIFHLGFIQTLSFADFTSHDQPYTEEPRKFWARCPKIGTLFQHEQMSGCLLEIFTEQGSKRFRECRFPILPAAIQKEEYMFGNNASQAIPHSALEKLYKLLQPAYVVRPRHFHVRYHQAGGHP